MVTLDQSLDMVLQLTPEEQDMLIEIVKKRQIELRRKEIAISAREAIAEYRAGKTKPESADEVILKLHQSLNEKDED